MPIFHGLPCRQPTVFQGRLNDQTWDAILAGVQHCQVGTRDFHSVQLLVLITSQLQAQRRLCPPNKSEASHICNDFSHRVTLTWIAFPPLMQSRMMQESRQPHRETPPGRKRRGHRSEQGLTWWMRSNVNQQSEEEMVVTKSGCQWRGAKQSTLRAREKQCAERENQKEVRVWRQTTERKAH